MKSFAMTLNLRADADVGEKYKRYHRTVWPEVLDGLRGIGITKMKIYRHGQRLFMYLEAGDDFDPARDFEKYMGDPRAKEWDELMRGFQAQVPGTMPDVWWATMEEVFDLNWY